MSDLTPMYGRLRHSLGAEIDRLRRPPRECQHPRGFHRIDEWTDPVADDPRLELVTTRTVCTGCDETIGYLRTRRPAGKR